MRTTWCALRLLVLTALLSNVAAQTSVTNTSHSLPPLIVASNSQVFLTGIAAFTPAKWAFITVRAGTNEAWLRLKEGEEKAGIKLRSVNVERAEAQVAINGVERRISFGAALPGGNREVLAKEERDREHARVSALRARLDRERDAEELKRHLQAVLEAQIPLPPEPSDED